MDSKGLRERLISKRRSGKAQTLLEWMREAEENGRDQMKPLSVKCVVIYVGLLMLGHAEVWGADWDTYFDSDFGTFSYDTKHITRASKNILRVWRRKVYTDKGVTDLVARLGKKYRGIYSDMELAEIDCRDRKSRPLSLTMYSADGAVVESWSFPEEPAIWNHIAPDTQRDALFRKVCK